MEISFLEALKQGLGVQNQVKFEKAENIKRCYLKYCFVSWVINKIYYPTSFR